MERSATPGRPPPTPRSTSIGLCAAWSRHAAELAVPVGASLERWEETPTVQAMVADGVLVRILPGIFLPPDLLGTAVGRALALGCALGGSLQSQHVIAGPSAAWVVLGGVPPSPAELLSPAHRGDRAGVVLRHARLRPDEVETIGGAPVTVPVRTAVDLLRFSPMDVARPALAALVLDGHVSATEIRQHLRGLWRHPGAHAARGRLEEVLGALVDTARGPGAGPWRRAAAPPAQLTVRGAAAPTGLPSAVTRYTS